MGRRLLSLAAAAVLLVALGAAPVSASSHAPKWTVIQDDMTPVAGMQSVCGNHTYTATSGSVHFVWLQQGVVDFGTWIAQTDGKATEDWTMLGVKVVDNHGRTHRVEGRQHVSASFSAGQDINLGPIDYYRLTIDIQIEGTHDGHHVVARWYPNGDFVVLSDKGTCTDLTLYS